jgi:hypothetical protein
MYRLKSRISRSTPPFEDARFIANQLSPSMCQIEKPTTQLKDLSNLKSNAFLPPEAKANLPNVMPWGCE